MADTAAGGPLGYFGSIESRIVREKIVQKRVVAQVALNVFREVLGFNAVQLSQLLDTSPRTIERRLAKAAVLDLSEGDRVYRLARIIDLAVELIGDPRRAITWIRTPHRYLGGETPLALIATEVGTQTVEESLYAIAYGGVA